MLACHKFGHYVSQCPNKKKKQVVVFADVDEFSTEFEKEFSLIAYLSTCSVSSIVWYINNGASTYMSGVRGCFSEFYEKGVNVDVELGDDRVVMVVGRGTILFQRSQDLP